MFPEKKFDANGVLINYAEGPAQGSPLVMLHGIPGLWQELLSILPHLMLQWHIFALDFRGQGKSARTTGQYHSSFYSKDIAYFLQQSVTEPAVLFGNSAGGLIALDTAAKIPERVKAIILGDSPIDMEWVINWMTSQGFKDYFTALRSLAKYDHTVADIVNKLADLPVAQEGDKVVRYGDQPGIDRTHLTQLATTLKYLDPGVLDYHAEGRADEYIEGFDLDSCLVNITCPVLLIQANPELGGMMTDRSVRHALSLLKFGYHVQIEEVGHDLGMEHWEVAALLRVLTAFLCSF